MLPGNSSCIKHIRHIGAASPTFVSTLPGSKVAGDVTATHPGLPNGDRFPRPFQPNSKSKSSSSRPKKKPRSTAKGLKIQENSAGPASLYGENSGIGASFLRQLRSTGPTHASIPQRLPPAKYNLILSVCQSRLPYASWQQQLY